MAVDPQALERHFARLADLDSADRNEALQALAREDKMLALRVAALLDAHEDQTLGLDALGDENLRRLADFDPAQIVGSELGGWRLTHELGRGGMGVVFDAERESEGIKQLAAIKLLSIPVFDRVAAERFMREAAVLAWLDHPGICRLLDWGRTERGWPYLVLDRIEGRPIDQAAADLPVKDRIELLARVAEAVGAAHRKLIVHLDIKPDNILVDDHGTPVLLDFGVSRMVSEDSGAATATLSRWLTPNYASPEQLRGETTSIATDIYALGVVLFQLATGERPHELTGLSVMDALERAESGPPPASRRVSGIGRDFDAVIAKAMHPDPDRRYASAPALADDLRALLARRPVAARPDSLGYRLGKLVQRHPIAAPGSALAMVAIFLLAGLLVFQASDLRVQRDRADREVVRSRAATDLLLGSIEAANPTGENAGATTVDEMLRTAVARADVDIQDDPLLAAESLLRVGDVRRALGQFAEASAIYESALAVLDNVPDQVHELRATALAGLATSLRHLEQPDRARELLDTELDNASGLKHWRLWVGRGQLANSEGDLATAEQALTNALQVVPASAHQGRAAIYMGLGNAHTAAGRFREALAWFERSVEAGREPPVNRETLAMSLLNSANVLSRLGQIDAALAAVDESLRLRIDMFGREHTRTIPSFISRSYVLMEAGRWDEAIASAREAADLERAVAGPETRRMAAIWGAVGLAAERMGDNQTAREGFSRALEVQEKLLPDDHPDLAVTRSNLASAMMAQGEYEASIELLMKAWSTHSALAEGQPSRSKAIAEVNIAHVWLELGDPEKGLQWASDALRGAEAVLDPQQWLLGHFRNVYAEALLANDRVTEARNEAIEVEQLYAASEIPVRSKSLQDNLNLLARIHDLAEQPEQAAYYRQRLDTLRSSLHASND